MKYFSSILPVAPLYFESKHKIDTMPVYNNRLPYTKKWDHTKAFTKQ